MQMRSTWVGSHGNQNPGCKSLQGIVNTSTPPSDRHKSYYIVNTSAPPSDRHKSYYIVNTSTPPSDRNKSYFIVHHPVVKN